MLPCGNPQFSNLSNHMLPHVIYPSLNIWANNMLPHNLIFFSSNPKHQQQPWSWQPLRERTSCTIVVPSRCCQPWNHERTLPAPTSEPIVHSCKASLTIATPFSAFLASSKREQQWPQSMKEAEVLILEREEMPHVSLSMDQTWSNLVKDWSNEKGLRSNIHLFRFPNKFGL